MTRDAPILLVEDDRNEVEIARRALKRAGIDAELAVAYDGQEALEALGLEGESGRACALPRVVFLDLKMPRVGGLQVLRRLRETPRTAQVPVVVLSSSDRQDDIRDSYELGANSFLLKHFDPRGPGTYFAEAARYWLDLNQTSQVAKGKNS